MAGILDSARYRLFVAQAAGVSVEMLKLWCWKATEVPHWHLFSSKFNTSPFYKYTNTGIRSLTQQY